MPIRGPDTVCGDERADRPLLHRRAGQPPPSAAGWTSRWPGTRVRCRPLRASSAPTGSTSARAVLLRARARAARPPARLLDLGCGWGPVALTPRHCSPPSLGLGGRRQPSGRWTSPRRNAAAAGLADFHACTPEEVPDDVTLRGDLVEPADPGRQGRAARHAAAWLPRLADGGTAYLVVQKNLGLGLAAAVAGRGTGREVPRPVLGRPSCERAHLQGAVSHAERCTTIAEPPPRRTGSAAAWTWCRL